MCIKCGRFNLKSTLFQCIFFKGIGIIIYTASNYLFIITLLLNNKNINNLRISYAALSSSILYTFSFCGRLSSTLCSTNNTTTLNITIAFTVFSISACYEPSPSGFDPDVSLPPKLLESSANSPCLSLSSLSPPLLPPLSPPLSSPIL